MHSIAEFEQAAGHFDALNARRYTTATESVYSVPGFADADRHHRQRACNPLDHVATWWRVTNQCNTSNQHSGAANLLPLLA